MVDEAILEARKIISSHITYERFRRYDKIYPYTTESISSYMKDLNGKKVLCVAGSGDHFLNAAYLGAKRIDVFDINEFALMYLKLKIAAVSSLDKESFYEFMCNNASKYFDKVVGNIYLKYVNFWNYYVRNMLLKGGIQSSNLFYDRSGIYPLRNYYMNNDGYSRLQRNINNNQLSGDIYSGDINNLRFSGKYDAIFLSNICEYMEDLDEFFDTVLRLYRDNLNNNGIIYYGYYYDIDNPCIMYFRDRLPDTQSLLIPGVYKEFNKVLTIRRR